MNDMTQTNLERALKIVGSRPARPDGVDKVTGRALFGADKSLPNMLVGRVLRSPYAHAKIISIEPDYSNFLISEKNINKLSTNNINSAIASKNYNYKIIKYSDPRAHQVKIKKNNRNHKNLKKTLKINEILKKEKQNSPFIIKIDIEGFEKELFESNFQWMDKFKIIIIEIHDWMTPSQSLSENYIIALSKTLKKNKRDLIILGENLVSIRIN